MAKDRAARKQAAPDVVAWLWPCSVPAWEVWCALQTQWLYSEGRRTGLSRAGVRAHLDELGLAGPERTTIYQAICAAEQASLDAWAEIAAKRQSQSHN